MYPHGAPGAPPPPPHAYGYPYATYGAHPQYANAGAYAAPYGGMPAPPFYPAAPFGYNSAPGYAPQHYPPPPWPQPSYGQVNAGAQLPQHAQHQPESWQISSGGQSRQQGPPGHGHTGPRVGGPAPPPTRAPHAPAHAPAPAPAPAPSMPAIPPGMPKTAAEGRFPCVACDRGFDVERDLAAHCRTHERCPHAPQEKGGCTFEAVHKVVMAHVLKEHARKREGTGGSGSGVTLPPSLLELIPEKYRGAAAVGSSEADIKRWREDRKRHFPTADRVAKRAEVAAVRADRGELPANSTRDVGKMRHREREREREREGGGAPPAATPAAATPAAAPAVPSNAGAAAAAEDDEEDIDEEEVALAAALAASSGGTSSAASSAAASTGDIAPGTEEVDGEAAGQPTAKRRKLEPKEPTASLLSGYDDDDNINADEDEDNDGPEEEKIAHTAADVVSATAATAPTATIAVVTAIPEEADTRLGVIRGGSSVSAADAGGSSSDRGGGRMDRDRDRTRPVCRLYPQGRCKLGRQCKFSHNLKDAHRGGSDSAGGASSAAGVHKVNTVCRWYLLGTCGAGSRCPYQHTATGDGGGPSTQLLRKLLASEVQRETSILLQAVRYVVRNDFFSAPPPPAAAAASDDNNDQHASAS